MEPLTTPLTTFEERAAFIRAHTVLAPVPFVEEIQIFTAAELAPIWCTTDSWPHGQGASLPFWCVPWAGGQALARWLLDHPESVRGLNVLDFGTGSGLVAIAAAKAGAARVHAVDVDALAVAAARLNVEANDVTAEVACVDIAGEIVLADVVLAGDVWYERAPATRFATWLQGLVGRGTRVITGDPGRAYVPHCVRELKRYVVPTPVEIESVSSVTARVFEVVRGPRGARATA